MVQRLEDTLSAEQFDFEDRECEPSQKVRVLEFSSEQHWTHRESGGLRIPKQTRLDS